MENTTATVSTATAAAATVTASDGGRENSSGRKMQSRRGGSDAYIGVAIHSQVMKIKEEIEKIRHPSLEHLQIRPVFLRDLRRQRSRSPLGLANRAIPVGNA